MDGSCSHTACYKGGTNCSPLAVWEKTFTPGWSAFHTKKWRKFGIFFRYTAQIPRFLGIFLNGLEAPVLVSVGA